MPRSSAPLIFGLSLLLSVWPAFAELAGGAAESGSEAVRCAAPEGLAAEDMPLAGNGQLVILRTRYVPVRGWEGADVLLDGQQIARLSTGSYMTLAVSPGRHEVAFRENGQSNRIPVYPFLRECEIVFVDYSPIKDAEPLSIPFVKRGPPHIIGPYLNDVVKKLKKLN